MGLEFTEMVICVEESFGIQIKDEDTYHIETPGELKEFVETKVKLADRTTCDSLK